MWGQRSWVLVIQYGWSVYLFELSPLVQDVSDGAKRWGHTLGSECSVNRSIHTLVIICTSKLPGSLAVNIDLLAHTPAGPCLVCSSLGSGVNPHITSQHHPIPCPLTFLWLSGAKAVRAHELV